MPTTYIVRSGDSLSKIARSYRLRWRDIYNDPENANFKKTHPNPNLIYPGDVLKLPFSESLYYEVPGMQLIPQQMNASCWYASAQMLINWKMNKLQMSLANLIPPELDAQCRQIRDANGGIVNNQIIAMAKRLGLQPIPPMSPTPDAFAGWLKKYGPLWVNGKGHIVVIAGIRGLSLKIYDPWPPNKGKIDWRSMRDWYVEGRNPSGQPDSSRDTEEDVETVFLHCP